MVKQSDVMVLRMLSVLAVVFIGAVCGELSQKFCGDPNQPNCVLPPCMLVNCTNFPLATCRDYQCGTVCKPEFWLNGNEVTSDCEADLTGGTGSSGSTSNSVAAGSSSPMFDAILANAESLGLVPSGGSDGTAPAASNSGTGTNTVASGSEPSSASSLFDALMGPSENSCPNGVRRVTCTIRPCDVTTCPGLSAATCKDNSCGECKAQFYIGQTEVTKLCQQQPKQEQQQQNLGSIASPGPQISNSFSQILGALSNSAAKVSPVTTSGSGLALQRLSSLLGVNTQSKCPPNKIARCNSALCRTSSCSNIPGAACRVSNCGGCFAKFYFKGQDVTSRCKQRQQQMTTRGFGQRRQRLPPWYYFSMFDFMMH